MWVRSVVELVAGLTMPISALAILARAYKAKQPLGPHTIQFCTITFLVPLILILALEGVLDGATIGTILGGLIGYALSGRRLIGSNDGDGKSQD